MFQVGLYKRTQGRIARQITFVAIAGAIVLASFRINVFLAAMSVGGPTAAERTKFAQLDTDLKADANTLTLAFAELNTHINSLKDEAGAWRDRLEWDALRRQVDLGKIDIQPVTTTLTALEAARTEAGWTVQFDAGLEAMKDYSAKYAQFQEARAEIAATQRWRAMLARAVGPFLFMVIGVWLAYRAVNVPSFADFLIAVEAEMAKVSWPSKLELYRYSIVVIVVIFALAGVLYSFDIIWRYLFGLIGVLK
jgi:preprotein translocase SecE subunit